MNCAWPCRFLMGHTNIGVAWMFNMVYSIALVFGSSWMVVNWAPQAAGAGVAEVMAYLNGCMLPHVRTWTPTLPLSTRINTLFVQVAGGNRTGAEISRWFILRKSLQNLKCG